MSIRVNSQSQSTLSTLRNSRKNQEKQQKSLEKLSSGQRINRAADDAAGLAIAQKMGEALKGLEQGMENAYDGLSLTQVADGALNQSSDNLLRMRELAMSAANGTLNSGQRDAVQAEFDSLKAEITRISETTEFNGNQLLDGSAGNVDIALGTQSGSGQDMLSLDLSTNLDAGSLGLAATSVSGADGTSARRALDDIDAALAMVSSKRSEFGSFSNRLMSAQQSLAISVENTHAAQSRIQDADFAVETSNLVRTQILGNSSNAVQLQSMGLASTALNLLK
jgi:flagellin